MFGGNAVYRLVFSDAKHVQQDMFQCEDGVTQDGKDVPERKASDNDGGDVVVLEALQARQDAAAVAATLSHTMRSGLEYVDDVLSNEVLTKVAMNTSSDYEELVMKPRLRLIGLTAPTAPIVATDLESKFDEESKEESVAATAKAVGAKHVDVAAASVGAMLSAVLRTDAAEAEAFLLSLNAAYVTVPRVFPAAAEATAVSVSKCLLKWLEGSAATAHPSLLAVVVPTLCNALFRIPSMFHHVLDVVKMLHTLPKHVKSAVSVDWTQFRYDESSPELPVETNDSFSVQLSASTKSTATASVPSGVHGNHTFCIVKDRLLKINCDSRIVVAQADLSGKLPGHCCHLVALKGQTVTVHSLPTFTSSVCVPVSDVLLLFCDGHLPQLAVVSTSTLDLCVSPYNATMLAELWSVLAPMSAVNRIQLDDAGRICVLFRLPSLPNHLSHSLPVSALISSVGTCQAVAVFTSDGFDLIGGIVPDRHIALRVVDGEVKEQRFADVCGDATMPEVFANPFALTHGAVSYSPPILLHNTERFVVKSAGTITSWTAQVAAPCIVECYVWRPLGGDSFSLVGSNTVTFPAIGKQTVAIPASDRIVVSPDDVIGLKMVLVLGTGSIETCLGWTLTGQGRQPLYAVAIDDTKTIWRCMHNPAIGLRSGYPMLSATVETDPVDADVHVWRQVVDRPSKAAARLDGGSLIIDRSPRVLPHIEAKSLLIEPLLLTMLKHVSIVVSTRQSRSVVWKHKVTTNNTLGCRTVISQPRERKSQPSSGTIVCVDKDALAVTLYDAVVGFPSSSLHCITYPGESEDLQFVASESSNEAFLKSWQLLQSFHCDGLSAGVSYVLSLLLHAFQRVVDRPAGITKLRQYLRRHCPGFKELLASIVQSERYEDSTRQLAMSTLAAGVQVMISSSFDVLDLLESSSFVAAEQGSILTALLSQRDYLFSCFVAWLNDPSCRLRLLAGVKRAGDAVASGSSNSVDLMEFCAYHVVTLLASGIVNEHVLSAGVALLSISLDVLITLCGQQPRLLHITGVITTHLCLPSCVQLLPRVPDILSLFQSTSTFLEQCYPSSPLNAVAVKLTHYSLLDNVAHTLACLAGRFVTVSASLPRSRVTLTDPTGCCGDVTSLWQSVSTLLNSGSALSLATVSGLQLPLFAHGIDNDVVADPKLSSLFAIAGVAPSAADGPCDSVVAITHLQEIAHLEAKKTLGARKFQAFGGLTWGDAVVDAAERVVLAAMLKHCGMLATLPTHQDSPMLSSVATAARKVRKWLRDENRRLAAEAALDVDAPNNAIHGLCEGIVSRSIVLLSYSGPVDTVHDLTSTCTAIVEFVTSSIDAAEVLTAGLRSQDDCAALRDAIHVSASLLASCAKPSMQAIVLASLKSSVFGHADALSTFHGRLRPCNVTTSCKLELALQSEALLRQLAVIQGRVLDSDANPEVGSCDQQPHWVMGTSPKSSQESTPRHASSHHVSTHSLVDLPRASVLLTASTFVSVPSFPTVEPQSPDPLPDGSSSSECWTSIRTGSQFERVRIVATGPDRTFDVDFDDGTRAANVPHTHLFRRLPSAAMLPSTATAASTRTHRDLHRHIVIHQQGTPDKPVLAFPLLVGSTVWGNYRGQSWYPGRIRAVNSDGTYDIAYDDGDTETNVTPANLAHPGAIRHSVQDVFVCVTPSGHVELQVESTVFNRLHTSITFGVIPLQEPLFVFQTATSKAVMLPDVWTHVAVTVDEDQVTLFVNGVVEGAISCHASVRSRQVEFGRPGSGAAVKLFGANATNVVTSADSFRRTVAEFANALPSIGSSGDSPTRRSPAKGPSGSSTNPAVDLVEPVTASVRATGVVARLAYLLLPAFAPPNTVLPSEITLPNADGKVQPAEVRLVILQMCLEALRRGSNPIVTDHQTSPTHASPPRREPSSPMRSPLGSPSHAAVVDISSEIACVASSNVGAVPGLLCGERSWLGLPEPPLYTASTSRPNVHTSVLPGKIPIAVLEFTIPEAFRLRFSSFSIRLPEVADKCPHTITISVSTAVGNPLRSESLNGLAPQPSEFIARRLITLDCPNQESRSRSSPSHAYHSPRLHARSHSSDHTNASSPTDSSSTPRETLTISEAMNTSYSPPMSSSPVLEQTLSSASFDGLPPSLAGFSGSGRWVTLLKRDQLTSRGIGRQSAPLVRIRLEILSTHGSVNGSVGSNPLDIAPQLDGISICGIGFRRQDSEGLSSSPVRGERDAGVSPRDTSLIAACFQKVSTSCVLGSELMVRRHTVQCSGMKSPRLMGMTNSPALSPARPPALNKFSDVCLEIVGNSLREVVTQVKIKRASAPVSYVELAEAAVGMRRHTELPVIPSLLLTPLRTPALRPGVGSPSPSQPASSGNLPDLSLGDSVLTFDGDSLSRPPSLQITQASRSFRARIGSTGLPAVLSSASLHSSPQSSSHPVSPDNRHAVPPSFHSPAVIAQRCRTDARVIPIIQTLLQLVKTEAGLDSSQIVADFFTGPFRFFTLVRLLKHGPLRVKLMVLRLLRYVLPLTSPDSWRRTLSEAAVVESLGSDVVSMMLHLAQGTMVLPVTPSRDQARENGDVMASSDSGDEPSLFSPPKLRGSRGLRPTVRDDDDVALASEAVMLLRHAVGHARTGDAQVAWRKSVTIACQDALRDCHKLITMPESANDGESIGVVIKKAASALAVCGGFVPTVRPGSLVTWTPSIEPVDLPRSKRYRPGSSHQAVVISMSSDTESDATSKSIDETQSRVVKVLVLAVPDEDVTVDPSATGGDQTDSKADEPKAEIESSSQLDSRLEYVLLSELTAVEEEMVPGDLLSLPAVQPFFVSMLAVSGDAAVWMQELFQRLKEHGMLLPFLELRCMALRSLFRMTSSPSPHSRWLLQACSDPELMSCLFRCAAQAQAPLIQSIIDGFVRQQGDDCRQLDVASLEQYCGEFLRAITSMQGTHGSLQDSISDSRSQSPSLDAVSSSAAMFIVSPKEDSPFVTLTYPRLEGLPHSNVLSGCNALPVCSGSPLQSASAFPRAKTLLIVIPEESIATEASDVTSVSCFPGVEPMSRRAAAALCQKHDPKSSGFPWGNVLHCKVSQLPSAIQQAECMGYSAVLVAALPLWAAVHSASGHPTSIVVDVKSCDCPLSDLPHTIDPVVAKVIQEKLVISVPQPSPNHRGSPQLLDTPRLRSALPIFVVSQRDGLYIESWMLDLYAWSSQLCAGSQVDCKLSVMDRWHGGVLYCGLAPPFSRWFRVGFPDLPWCVWRWVERPLTHSCWAEGVEDDPPACVVDSITLRLRWGCNVIAPPGWVSSWVSDEDDTNSSPTKLLGKRVSVQWARNHWYDGVIDDYNQKTNMYHITYDDGDVRWYDMSKKVFRIHDADASPEMILPPPVNQDAVLRAMGVWRASLAPGVRLDVLDDHNRWHEAEVKRCLPSPAMVSEVEVRYLGWSFASQPDKFDEVIACGSHRLAPAGTKTTRWRHVQMGDHVTLWVRPGGVARNELRDFTVIALAPSQQIPRNNSLSLYQVGLGRGQVDVGTGITATGADGYGHPNASDLTWVSLDDYHQVCNYSTHRAGEWMLVDKEREDCVPKLAAWTPAVWSLAPSSVADASVHLASSFDLVSGSAHGHTLLMDSVLIDPALTARLLSIAQYEGADVDDGDVTAALASCGCDAFTALGLLTCELRNDTGRRHDRILNSWTCTTAAASPATAVAEPCARSCAGVYEIHSNTVIKAVPGECTTPCNAVVLPSDVSSAISLSLWVSIDALGSSASDNDGLVFPLAPGTTVWANFKDSGSWYPGHVVAVNPDSSYHIAYDDGDTELAVPEECLSDRKLSFNQHPSRAKSGLVLLTQPALNEDAVDPTSSRIRHPVPANTPVRALYRGGSDWIDAIVTGARPDGTYEVLYPHGEREDGVRASSIRERQSEVAVRRQKLSIEITGSGRVVLRLKTTSTSRLGYTRPPKSSFQRVVSRNPLRAGTNEWHHVVAVVGPSKLELFVDGVLEGSLTTQTVVSRAPLVVVGNRQCLLPDRTIAALSQALQATAQEGSLSATMDLMSSLISASLRSNQTSDEDSMQSMMQFAIQPLGLPRYRSVFGPLISTVSPSASSGVNATSTSATASAAGDSATGQATTPSSNLKASVSSVKVFAGLLSPDAVRAVMKANPSTSSSVTVSALTSNQKATVASALLKCYRYSRGTLAQPIAIVDGSRVAAVEEAIREKAGKVTSHTEFSVVFRNLTSLKSEASCLSLEWSAADRVTSNVDAVSSLPFAVGDVDDNRDALFRASTAAAVALKTVLAQRVAWAVFVSWPLSGSISNVVPPELMLRYLRGVACGAIPTYAVPSLPIGGRTVPYDASDSKTDAVIERDSKDDDESAQEVLVMPSQSVPKPKTRYEAVVLPILAMERSSCPSLSSIHPVNIAGLVLSECLGHLVYAVYPTAAVTAPTLVSNSDFACNLLHVFVDSLFYDRKTSSTARIRDSVFRPQTLDVLLRNLAQVALTTPPTAVDSERSEKLCLTLLRLATAIVRGCGARSLLPMDSLITLKSGFERYLALDGILFKGSVFVGDIALQLVTLFVAVYEDCESVASSPRVEEVDAKLPAPQPVSPPLPPHSSFLSTVPSIASPDRGLPRTLSRDSGRIRRSSIGSDSGRSSTFSDSRASPQIHLAGSPLPARVFAMEPDGSAALVPIPPGDIISESDNEEGTESDVTTSDGSRTHTPSPAYSPYQLPASQPRQSPFATVLDGPGIVSVRSFGSRTSPVYSNHGSDHEDPDLDASSVRRVHRRSRVSHGHSRRSSVSSVESNTSLRGLRGLRQSQSPQTSPRFITPQQTRRRLLSQSDSEAEDGTMGQARSGVPVRSTATVLSGTTSASVAGTQSYRPPAFPPSIRAMLAMASHDREPTTTSGNATATTVQRADRPTTDAVSWLSILESLQSRPSFGGPVIRTPSADPLQSVENRWLAAAIAMSIREAFPSAEGTPNPSAASITCPTDLLSVVHGIVATLSEPRPVKEASGFMWTDGHDRACVHHMNSLDAKHSQSDATLPLPSLYHSFTEAECMGFTAEHPLLSSAPPTVVLERLTGIQAFNRKFVATVSFLDLSPSSFGLFTPQQVSRLRTMIVQSQKDDLLKKCLRATVAPDFRPSVTLNRFMAIKHPHKNMFKQLMRQLEAVHHPSGTRESGPPGYVLAFRSAHSGNRPWHVRSFVGEHGLDLGGLFNSALTEAIEAAMSGTSFAPIPLFVPTPNHRDATGRDRDRLTFHPQATTPQHVAMFRFLGHLIGVTIRLGFPIDLRLPKPFWKRLVGEVPTLFDLDYVDSAFVESIKRLQVAKSTGDASLLQHVMFVSVLSDGSVKNLVPNGSTVPVTLDNVSQYIEAAVQARLDEAVIGLDAVLEGVFDIVPRVALSLYTPDEVEVLVCGKPMIDIEMLKRHTEYGGGMNAGHPLAEMFWSVLSGMTPEEQGLVLRFTYGRTRLPVTDSGYTRCFKLQALPASLSGNSDHRLPTGHTCVFQLCLPRYSSADVLRTQLLRAASMCVGYDLDDAGHGSGDVVFDDDTGSGPD